MKAPLCKNAPRGCINYAVPGLPICSTCRRALSKEVSLSGYSLTTKVKTRVTLDRRCEAQNQNKTQCLRDASIKVYEATGNYLCTKHRYHPPVYHSDTEDSDEYEEDSVKIEDDLNRGFRAVILR